jgi:hypothetical protein
VACGNEPETPGDPSIVDPTIGPAQPGAVPGSNDPHDPKMEILPDPLAGLPKGAEQLTKVCSRGGNDVVTKAFCTNGKTVTSITELQDAIGLLFKNRSDSAVNGGPGNPAWAFLGHSSSLVARDVSAINPRAFLFTAPPGQAARLPGFVVMGFGRGETFVEIAADDPQARHINFYLLKFDIACEATKNCGPADLLTAAVEKNWKGTTLYGDEDLKNTILDCRQCHQPGGPGTDMMLRMQELADPWTHWFRTDRPGGQALLADFHAAHGTEEDYMGVPGHLIEKGDGRALEDFVSGQGFFQQPNVFDSKKIETEVKRTSSSQPEVNMPVGQSSTWQALYDAAAQGDFIPVPYHDVKVTDPQKLQFATDAYQKFLAGGSPNDLPDIRRVFLDDALPEMTMRPRAGATGEQIVVQMCSQCHNPRLDTSISRSHFDALNMTPAMKQQAIARMKLPASDIRHMPPAMFRTIPDDQLATVVTALSK